MATSLSPLDQLRTDWYQTDVAVVITLLVRDVRPENLDVSISERKVCVHLHYPNLDERHITFDLQHAVDPERSSFKITPTKVEVKLRKLETLRWLRLERHAHPDAQTDTSYPSARRTDWSQVERDIIAEEALEAPKSEGVNELFQKIYGEGSDEVKKAMNKSYMESGGTVLSTNWSEVSKATTEIKPPDGVEYRKWD